MSIAFRAGLGVIGIAGGIGLLRMQSWARIATMIFAALFVALSALLLTSWIRIATKRTRDSTRGT